MAAADGGVAGAVGRTRRAWAAHGPARRWPQLSPAAAASCATTTPTNRSFWAPFYAQ